MTIVVAIVGAVTRIVSQQRSTREERRSWIESEAIANQWPITPAITGDPGEADDFAQEALSRGHERREGVSRMDSSKGYLFRTALSLHRERARRLRMGASIEIRLEG